jgi:uncharacterized protein YecE (DUF72 family)
VLAIGTSGWQYKHWRGRFYPPGLPESRWLEYYAQRFATVEVNNTFYRLPPPGTFASWAARTPADFVVAVKASAYLTHYRRLLDPEEPVERLLTHAAPLGARLGPVLVQLPPDMKAAPERLDATLRAFGRRVRVAVEPRHQSWFSEEVHAILTAHGAASCLADRRSRPITPLWRTADWYYVRFHAGTATPAPCYGARALTSWVARLHDLWGDADDGYAYFNNDSEGCAVRDAILFARAALRSGIDVSRVPPLSEAPVGQDVGSRTTASGDLSVR